MAKAIKLGIIGASGYTGADAVRLLAAHPQAQIVALAAHSHAGQSLAAIFPQFGGLDLPPVQRVSAVDWTGVDAVICGLPHGVAQDVIAALPQNLKIIDMSADFRLRDAASYATWYGRAHAHPQLLQKAVYGLSEHYADAIANADLVACPGCYPTAALLLLLPLLAQGLIEPQDIIIDAKSGVSGAGRGLKEQNLFCEIAENMHPYSVAAHRHAPEIEQELSRAAKQSLVVSFTPHLVPMNRGELLSVYVRGRDGAKAADMKTALNAFYAGKNFVRVVDDVPATRHVRGSNFCLLAAFDDRLAGRVILFSTIDNLVKGSSGQAIQNMNLMFGLAEDTGLKQQPLYP